MSIIKDKLTSRSPQSSLDRSSDAPIDSEADKYRLLITAGPSYDTSTHKIVHVNTSKPTVFENEFLIAAIKVRIRGYRGLPSHSPSTSAYFDDPVHTKDQYSIAFSFVPKLDLPSVDTVWGNDFDHPVRDRLPPGFNTAFKIVKEFIDPGLECDAYADEPWLYGPGLSCWFAFGVGDKDGADDAAKRLDVESAEGNDALHEGADSDQGFQIRQQHNIPENNEKRRKYFLSATNRQNFTFEKGRTYHGDFYNPYLDFGNFALKLPGFSIRVIKYIDEKSHRLRYVFKNRKTGNVYFCVNLNLLWGEELKTAMEDEQKVEERHAGAEKVEVNGHADDQAGVNGEQHDPGKEQSQEPVEPTDETSAPSAAHAREENGDSDKQRPGEQLPPDNEPGLIDKPPELVEQIKTMSIQEMLQNTASVDRTKEKTRFLDDDVD